VRAVDQDNKPFEIEADGLLAVCIQHEMDHLLGKVFVEYLSPLKRNRIKNKMLKARRETERA
jgi:peptide deformylase